MSEAITRLNAALEGHYRIGSELGEAGIATVYLAEDIKLSPQVTTTRCSRMDREPGPR